MRAGLHTSSFLCFSNLINFTIDLILKVQYKIDTKNLPIVIANKF